MAIRDWFTRKEQSPRQSSIHTSTPAFEMLEPRLLLSSFPTILETPLPHDSLATAQDITTDMSELSPGEGSFGVRIEGETQADTRDYYEFEVLGDAVYVVHIDPAESEYIELGMVRPERTDKWGTWNESRSYTYSMEAGTYYIYMGSLDDLEIGYSLTITTTYPTMPDWHTLAYDMGTRGAEPAVEFTENDPTDVFWVPKEPGETFYYKIIDDSYSHDPSMNSYSAGDGAPASMFCSISLREDDVTAGAYLGMFLATDVDLSEPNNDPSQAIDVTAYLRDAPDGHPYADRMLYLYTTHTDGTDDWYKFTLDQPYVEQYDGLKDASGNTVQGVLSPGTYYFKSSNYGYGMYRKELLLQEVNDGGGFVEVQPGLWKVTLYANGPHDQQTFAIAKPTDVFTDESFTGNVNFYRTDSGYVYVKLNRTDLADTNPLDIYAYEVTQEIGSSSSAATATPLKILPLGGNPDFLVSYANATRTVGERDYFRFNVPWEARISANSADAVVDSDGHVVSEIADPGTYYYVSDEATSDGNMAMPLSIRRYVDLPGGADIAGAVDIDPYMFATRDGRTIGPMLDLDGGWYGFSASEGETVSVSDGVTIYQSDGTSIPLSWCIPADGRYYLSASGTSLATYFTIDHIVDITDALAATQDADGVQFITLPPLLKGDLYDYYDAYAFDVNEITALLTGDVYASDGTRYYDDIWSSTFLTPGRYYVRANTNYDRMIKIAPLGQPVDIDPLFTYYRPESDTEFIYYDYDFVAGIYTFTVDAGDYVDLTVYDGGDRVILDADGRSVSEGYLQPGIYEVWAHAKNPVSTFRVYKMQTPEMTFTEDPDRSDWYTATNESGKYRHFVAWSDGTIWTKGEVTTSHRSDRQNASFRAGEVVWAKGSEIVLDTSPLVDSAVTNDSQATAINIDSLWWAQPKGADALFLRGQFDSTTGEEWFSFTMQEGDYIFCTRDASETYWVDMDFVDSDGAEVSVRPIETSGTYYIRIEDGNAIPGGQSYGVFLQVAHDVIMGNSDWDNATSLDYLYVPGEDLEFTGAGGKFQLTCLTSDMGWWYESFSLTNLLWGDGDGSPYASGVRPARSGRNNFELGWPTRVVIHFVPTDETEPNDTLETAQDITHLLVQDGDTYTATFSGAMPRNGEPDWFRFQIDDYSTIQASDDNYWAYIGMYNVNGDLIESGSNVFDEHMEPGEFYISVHSKENAMYNVTVEISPGTLWPGDGDDTWQEATVLNPLLDGQLHTVEGDFERRNDEDWYVFQPTGEPYIVDLDNIAMHDRFYEYNGKLHAFSDENYRDCLVIYDSPLYLRQGWWHPDHTTYSFSIQDVTPEAVTPLTPLPTDPSISTFHTTDGGHYLIQVPMGSGIAPDYYGSVRVTVAQPPDIYSPSEATLVYRDTYALVTFWKGHAGQYAYLDINVEQYQEIDSSQMVNTGAPDQGHYEYSIELPPHYSWDARWVYRPYEAKSSVYIDGPHSHIQNPDMGPEWPDLAHIFRFGGGNEEDDRRILNGYVWYSDEVEPNDDLASAQRIDDLWQPWLTEGSQLEISGYIGPDDPADNFVFHMNAREAVFFYCDNDFVGTIVGDYVVDYGNNVYGVTQSGDVYLTGLTGNYNTKLLRGRGIPTNSEISQAEDITADMADGVATIIAHKGYMTFLCEPGRVYATTEGVVVYSETGEVLWHPDDNDPLAFKTDRDQVVLSTRSFYDWNAWQWYGTWYGEIRDVTDSVIDLDSLSVPAGDNVRTITTTLQDGDVFSFTADGNEVFRYDITSSEPDQPYAREAEATIMRLDGTRATVHIYSSYENGYFAGEGVIYGLAKGWADLTLDITLTQTEPDSNNLQSTPTNITDLLQPSQRGGVSMTYEGVMFDGDTVDWLSVDLQPGQYVTTYAQGYIDILSIRPPTGVVSVSQTGGHLITERIVDSWPYNTASKVATEPGTHTIRVIRGSGIESVHYTLSICVRDVEPIALEDLGAGDYEGQAEGEIIKYGPVFDVDIYSVEVPGDSIMLTYDVRSLFDANGRRLCGNGITTSTPETIYLANWPRERYNNTTYYTVKVDIRPLWELDLTVCLELDYTLADIERIQGQFSSTQERWWHADLDAGHVITLGRPLAENTLQGHQTDLFLIRSASVSYPWDVTPEENPPLFENAQRYQILQSGDYYILAVPGILSDGNDYDWQALVQLAADFEPNNTMVQATDLNDLFDVDSNGRAVLGMTGTLEGNNDVDWFKATVEAGDFLYAGITWEGGNWPKLPLEIYGPDEQLIWYDRGYGGVDRMIYAAQEGTYWFRTWGSGIAYSLEITHGATTPVALAGGPQSFDAPAEYDMWMAAMDLPAKTALNTDWRHIHDSAGHLIDASCDTWIGLPREGVYYVAVYDGPLYADAQFTRPYVADADNHLPAEADSLDDVFDVPPEQVAAHAYVLGLYGEAGTVDYYSVLLNPGDALTGGAIGRWAWDEVKREWYRTYPDMFLLWQGQELNFPRHGVFVADQAGDAVIGVRAGTEWECYRLGIMKVEPGQTGAHDGPELIGGRFSRNEMTLEKGDGATADQATEVYDGLYNFLGRVETGSWFAPADGTYHIFTSDSPTGVTAPIRPMQVVYLTFEGGIVDEVPELDVNFGTLEPFDAGAFNLAGRQDEIQQVILTKIQEKFAGLDVAFVTERPESLPFSKIYITNSTPVADMGLAMLDGINTDLFDDAYVFAGNILNGEHGLANWNIWDSDTRFNALVAALSNVASAELGRVIGAQPLTDSSDLMALGQWADLTADLQFSDVSKSVADLAIVQDTRYVLAQALSGHTPGATIELHSNDVPEDAITLTMNNADGTAVVLGSINLDDTDYFQFFLDEPTDLEWVLTDQPGDVHIRILDDQYQVVWDDIGGEGYLRGWLPEGHYYIQLTQEEPMAAAMYSAGSEGSNEPTEPYTLVVRHAGEAQVVGRHVFYNDSYFDENDPSAGAADDGAIATNKQALLPSETATFANYTSYWRGINGVMVDIDGLVETPTASDFTFKVGNDNDPGGWRELEPHEQPSVTVREGAGEGGSDRVTLIWADNSIEKQWLQVTVLATANTGLADPDVFYFGNAVGETGNTPLNTFVDGTDFAGVRDHPRNFLNRAPVTYSYDINQDSFVDGSDLAIVRDNPTNFLTDLELITVPGQGVGAGASMAMAGSGYDDQNSDSTTPIATKYEMAVLSSEPVEPLAASASSDASASSNLLMEADAPLTVQTFEGNTVATRLADAFEETAGVLVDVGTLDTNFELVLSNDLNVGNVATTDGQVDLGVYQAAEAEAADETAGVGLVLDLILDELDSLELPDFQQLGAL